MTDKTIPEMAKELNGLINCLPKQAQALWVDSLSQAKRGKLVDSPSRMPATMTEFRVKVAIINYLQGVIRDDMTLKQVASYMTSLRKDMI